MRMRMRGGEHNTLFPPKACYLVIINYHLCQFLPFSFSCFQIPFESDYSTADQQLYEKLQSSVTKPVKETKC
jgi:hypothetical protein